MKYKKTCKFCGNEFESDSRGTRYCSTECCEKAQGKNRRRAKRRREYDKNREANLLVSTAYALAQRVAAMFGIPQDMDKAVEYVKSRVPGKELPKAEGRWELHHISNDVFDNRPSNLIWLPVELHAFYHSHMNRVNVISVFEGKEEASFDVKYSLYQELVEEAQKRKK